ncbi:hypothetical protein [Lactobacillus sp. ESL0703]|uniref:hypothetical protein n=1 Tax=Lactobacillus sp. ESL0703 TaxID=2983218 RepID=UPI0023F827BD|nr:hypothetical protein [Lactobacillus sp. ESL0703]MDF7669543.1 hypothetical protein [Lactobacillus sp. ESL0703]
MFKFLIKTSHKKITRLIIGLVLIALCASIFGYIGPIYGKPSIWPTFFNLSVGMEMAAFVLPLVTLFVGFSIFEIIGTSYFDVIEIRAGERKDDLNAFMVLAFFVAFLIELIFLVTVVIKGILTGTSADSKYLVTALIEFWLQLIDIYVFLLFMLLIQLIFKKTGLTFLFGSVYTILMFGSLKGLLPFNRPIIAGTELFFLARKLISPAYSFLGLIWLIIMVIAIKFTAIKLYEK